jgi:hypothetical protein
MTPREFFNAMCIFGELDVAEGADPTVATNVYLRGLGRYSNETLQRAADRMLAERKQRKFPLPAECLEACRAAQDEIVAEARRENDAQKQGAKSNDPWSAGRVKLADRMMDSDPGRQAAQEGWIVSLHDFCREEARLPNRFEAERVRTAALRRKAEREEREREFGGSPKIIRSVAQAMKAKERRLCSMASGKETK